MLRLYHGALFSRTWRSSNWCRVTTGITLPNVYLFPQNRPISPYIADLTE